MNYTTDGPLFRNCILYSMIAEMSHMTAEIAILRSGLFHRFRKSIPELRERPPAIMENQHETPLVLR